MPDQTQSTIRKILEKTEMFKEFLVETATGGQHDVEKYLKLRKELLAVQLLRDRLPDFVRSCRNVSEYWDFMKEVHSTYQGRREFLRDSFNPLLNELEEAMEDPSRINALPSAVETKPSKGSLRVFISHSHKDRHQAAIVKSALERYGMEVFVAHEDITTSAEWEDAILEYLRTTDLFVPIITNSFTRSEWTNQETGVAYEKGAAFFPLIVDLPPYGFIGKYQGMKCIGGVTEEHASRIIEELLKNDHIKSRVLDSLVNALGDSASFEQSNAIVRRIELVKDELDSKRINAICRAWLGNNQVRESFGAKSFIYEILREKRDAIDPQLLPNLEGQVEAARSF